MSLGEMDQNDYGCPSYLLSSISRPACDIPLFCGSNYAHWKDIGFSHALDYYNLIKGQEKCLYLEAHAYNALSSALSAGVEDVIFKKFGFLESAHLLWMALKETYGSREDTLSSSEFEPEIPTSSTSFNVQEVKQSSCEANKVQSASLGKPEVPVSQTGSSGFGRIETSSTRNDENDWCRFRPSEESVSSSDSEGEHFMCLMAKGKKKPIKKDESESEDDDLEFDKLSKKDMYKIMKLMKKIEEQELQLEKQEQFLIVKMEELEALSIEHKKLHNLHISLTNDYDNLKKDYACATNSSPCVASLQQENCNLKAQFGVLTSKQVNLQKSHEVLLCSHEDLIEAHALLEISHEVVLTMVKSYQPHTCNCTSTEMSIDLSCANVCCSQVKPSCDEHILVETCDDFIASENDNLMREVEKLKNELRVLKGKGHVQPSQDNRDDMVKKLEKGSTVTCAKSPSNKLKKIHDKSAQVIYLKCSSSMGHFASKCPSKKIDQTSLSRRQRRLSQRKCFGCMEEGHKIASCPKKRKSVQTSQNRRLRLGKPEVPVSVENPQVVEKCGKGFVSAYDRYMGKCGSTRRQIKDKERRIKYRICYTCRTKGHIGKDCPMAQVSIPKLVNIDSLAMKATNDPCVDKVISSPSVSTKLIWVPKSCVTNIEGPNKIWVPKFA
ncbi:hypothetical protein EJB05_33105, partial [Eragrostis curvula]